MKKKTKKQMIKEIEAEKKRIKRIKERNEKSFERNNRGKNEYN